MPVMLIVMIALHVLPAVFWLGSCLVVAINKGAGSERMFRPQMVAAVVTVFFGVGLWSMLHRGGMGPTEIVLAVGALCAIAAAGAEGALVGGSIRKLRSKALAEPEARRKMALGQGIAAGLLTVALLCMVGAKFA
jgi:hypothetical protein